MKKLNLNNFENYLITSDGKIFNTLNTRGYKRSSNQLSELKSYSNKNSGYMMVVLRNSNTTKKATAQYVHRLVAYTYIPNPENKPMINHKDGNKHNNNISNLEWVTQLENMKHAWEMGLLTSESLSKKTIAIRNNKDLLDKGIQHYKLYHNFSFVQKMWSLKSQHIVRKLLIENGVQIYNKKGTKYHTGSVSPFIEQEIKNYFISVFNNKKNKLFKTPSEYVLHIKQKYGIKFSLGGYYRIRLSAKNELQNLN